MAGEWPNRAVTRNEDDPSPMLFGVESDSGSTVVVYLVPDSGGSVGTIQISSGGVELMTMQPNEVRQAVVAAGRHSTGICAFRIDETIIPGLADYADLEITDAANGLIVYRRVVPNFIADTKVFRLETHLLPLWRLDDVLRKRFQYWYKGVDRQGLETTTQVFCINQGTSNFISGRVLIKGIEYYLNKGFRSTMLFRDPYDELAERLIVLKSITSKTMELLGPRDALLFEPVMRYLAEFDQFDEVSVKRMFKRAPEDVLAPLANPLTRQLTATTPDEQLSKGAIAPALQVLADFEIIGLRSDAAHFSHALADILGLEPNSLPVMSEYGRVTELGQKLRGLHDVEGILEHDLEIFFHTKQAFGSVA